MIDRITIENFKSIAKLDLELGRVNVLIGENGCGKTNILEAIAFAGAAASDRLDGEFLSSRGIRVTEPRFMRSAFTADEPDVRIAGTGAAPVEFKLKMTTANPPLWSVEDLMRQADVSAVVGEGEQALTSESLLKSVGQLGKRARDRHAPLRDFRVYAPENSALRRFQDDSRIFPLSIDGTGLYAYLKGLSVSSASGDETLFTKIADRLALLDWFESLEIPKDLVAFERRFDIRDRYLAEGALFDQSSANEGLFFLLFYFTLLMSPDTPKFFAIDNIDTSLNPKLCTALMRQIVELAKKHDKQVILTTHNPATLDGLNLKDDDQRLLVVYRTIDGDTTARRVGPPKRIEGVTPVSLSEAFVRGYIGGLPDNF